MLFRSTVADNALFRASTADYVVHLDDDGWVEHQLLQLVESHFVTHPQSLWYGHTVFHLDGCRKYDRRITKGYRWLTSVECYGALWAAPLPAIQALGGHNEADLYFRGGDARLGYALSQHLPAWYETHPAAAFHHIGETWSDQMRRTNPKLMIESQRIPAANLCTPA